MSGFYIGVDGKARKVKSAYIGVDGVARKVKSIYIGDENGKARKCYVSGKKLSRYIVGSTVYLNENGNPVAYLIVHQGVPSNLYDSSCDGVWLLRKDCHSERAFNIDRDNKYPNSEIHTYLNNDFLVSLDSKLQSIIKQVKIPYYNGSSISSGANGLSTKVFMLGTYEVGFTTSQNYLITVDGAKLDYFESGTDTSANTKRIATLNGTAVPWWTRTSHLTNTQYVFDVSASGDLTGDYAHNNDGVRPALILPYDTLVDDGFNIIV